MTGLNKITDKITGEAKAEAAQRLAKADAECTALTEQYRRRAEEIRTRLNAEAKAEAEETVLRARASVETMARDRMLAAKSEQIDRAFALAQKEFFDLSEEEYRSFLAALLRSTVRRQAAAEAGSRLLYGEEDGERVERYELLLNGKDAARHGKALLEAVRGGGESDDERRILSALVLGEEEAAIDGGLVLRCGNMEINHSLSALFAAIRPELEAKVGQKLFPEQ
ncbi:MAG: hypothetical protein IJY42_03300 [Clostridia bacterium]|nr:hypothetical protein [Clostridia bacterium]